MVNEKRILDISSEVRSRLPRILFTLLVVGGLSAFAFLGVSGAECSNIVTPDMRPTTFSEEMRILTTERLEGERAEGRALTEAARATSPKY